MDSSSTPQRQQVEVKSSMKRNSLFREYTTGKISLWRIGFPLLGAWMAESGRVAGSAPADPDPESGQSRPDSA
ncbi:hypothetical protein Taro_035188 [Colocasia esculenta]|uniref:Uncharacterized protein n=1 Tax=Colocasia esculenta TaxID=4460 RepID=A0A843W326_COLES|nr:hypothetical protein [Colocasia esculenta]